MPAILVADFLSGFVHFCADRFGSLQTPLLGKNVIRSFREHHHDAKAMTHHDFVTIAGDSCLLTVPYLAIVLALFPPIGTASRVFAMFSLFFATFVFMTSQIHKWAHLDVRPRIVTWLQQHRLLLSPEHHAKHHSTPHDSAYATTTGWLNPILDDSRFFVRFESAVRALVSLARTPRTRGRPLSTRG